MTYNVFGGTLNLHQSIKPTAVLEETAELHIAQEKFQSGVKTILVRLAYGT